MGWGGGDGEQYLVLVCFSLKVRPVVGSTTIYRQVLIGQDGGGG